MRGRNGWISGFVLAATFALGACQKVEDGDMPPAAPGPVEERLAEVGEDVELTQDEPSFLLTLPSGERLSFYMDADGSAGVLGELPVGSKVGATLDHPALQGASPAMVYFAVVDEGVEIPLGLRAHHEGLAREGKVPALAEAVSGLKQGWLLRAPAITEDSPCLNATFTANHCAHPDYTDAVCKLNTGADWSWNVPGANRYKAGFCLQEGSARSWLFYRSEASGCTYFSAQNFVWGFNSYLFGDTYSATTYFTYTWWRGSGAPHRWFFHFGGDGVGDVFDWGNRYSWESCP